MNRTRLRTRAEMAEWLVIHQNWVMGEDTWIKSLVCPICGLERGALETVDLEIHIARHKKRDLEMAVLECVI